jgi:hypothetical protein
VTIEIGLMQLLSDNKTDFTILNSILAMYLQIRDDYCNLCLQQVTSDLSVQDGYVTRVPKIDTMKVCVALI